MKKNVKKWTGILCIVFAIIVILVLNISQDDVEKKAGKDEMKSIAYGGRKEVFFEGNYG